jgi:sugar phosphate permease
MVMSVSCIVALIFRYVQDAIKQRIGHRWMFALTNVLSIIALVPTLITKNRWVLLVSLSLNTTNYLALEGGCAALIGLLVPPEEAGDFIGILDIALETGGWAALLAFQLGVGWAVDLRGPTIGCGAIGALIGLFFCPFIKDPLRDGSDAREQQDVEVPLYVDGA